MKRREALGILFAGTCGLAGCAGKNVRTTTRSTTRTFDMPPRETLTGWPTYRARPGHTGLAVGASGPSGESLDARWETRLRASGQPRFSVAGGVVLVARGKQGVSAFDFATGDRAAADLATGDVVTTEIAVHDGTVYFGTHAGEVVAVDAATGDREWAVQTNRFRDENDRVVSLPVTDSTPAVYDGRVYAGGPTADQRPDGTAVFCIEDGEVTWRFETGQDAVSSPVVADGRVYARFGTALVAIDAADGTERWRASVGGDRNKPSNGSAPAVADGTVFLTGPDGRVHAFDAGTGDRQWSFETDGPTGLEWSALSPAYAPTMADGRAFVGASDGGLYALDAESGEAAWRFDPDETVAYWTVPAVAGGTVYAGANPPIRDSDGSILEVSREEGTFFAVDAETGSLNARHEIGGLTSAPAVGDGVAVVGAVSRDRSGVVSAIE